MKHLGKEYSDFKKNDENIHKLTELGPKKWPIEVNHPIIQKKIMVEASDG